jgi:glycosyltransferase involved in cell wall biosynthesis
MSVVLPALNEAVSLPGTIDRLLDWGRQAGQALEIVVVDDGSSDRTVDVITALQVSRPVVLVQLSRNFGKEAALTAGLAHARGDVVVMMDADGQHPIELLDPMLQHWRAGADQVVGVIEHRQGTPWVQRLTVKLFYAVVNRRSRFRVPADAGDFRLLDRRVVDTLLRLPERTRFMKGLYAWAGYPTVLLPFQPLQRQAGQTHFSRAALAGLALDGLTSFSDWPLQLANWLGTLCALASLGAAAWFVFEHFWFGNDVPGWSTVVVLQTLLAAAQLICLGILSAYVSRLFQESKQRPLYVVQDVYRPRDPA